MGSMLGLFVLLNKEANVLPTLLLLISGALEIRWSVGAKGCMPPRLGRVRGPWGFGRVEEVKLFALLLG